MIFKYPKIKLIYELLKLFKDHITIFFSVTVFSLIVSSWKWIAIFAFYLCYQYAKKVFEVLFTRVEFAEDGVREFKGKFSKSERFIPKDKFENVQTSSTVLQRLFDVHSVTMETGDMTGEIMLDFVKDEDVEKMKAYILSEKMADEEVESEREVLFTPTKKDIFKASILSFSFIAIVPLIFKVQDFLRDANIEDVADPSSYDLSLLAKILIIAAVIFVAFIIGVAKTFNEYLEYEISVDEERIYVQKGWLSKKSFSIRKDRTQAVIYKQSLYQKLLGVTTIKLVSTGEILSDAEEINEFFPYLPTKDAEQLVEKILPNYVCREMPYKASDRTKKLIWLRPPLLAIAVACAGFWKPIFFGIAIAVLIYTYWNRMLAYNHVAFNFTEDHLQMSYGGFIRETIVTKRPRLVRLNFEQSRLQKRFDVFTLNAINRGHPILVSELIDIDVSMKAKLLEWFQMRVNEVQIDPRTQHGALKKEIIARLASALKLKSQSL